MPNEQNKETKKAVELNMDELESISGGEIYGKPNGDHFEVWFRCPKCNQYETMIYAHSNTGHMMSKMTLSGLFYCEYCGHTESFNIEHEF